MQVSFRAIFFVLVVCTVISLIFVRLNVLSARPAPDAKTILYWTPMFHRRDMYLGLGSSIFQGCDYSNCFATDDRSIMAVEEFDAVMFHARQYYQRSDFNFPQNRTQKQVYIMLDMESPVLTYIQFMKDYPDFFNWTMTYRRDSDVLRPYFYIEETPKEYQLPSLESIQSRPKKIAWFVSRCESPSKREIIVQELNNYIPVDIFGECGDLKCAQDDLDLCLQILENNYKFYLSFENSICEDYVTEKLYNALKLNVIPIVYGGANYLNLAPKESYIDVRDFKSTKHLADHLMFLDDHPEEYVKYFEWKSEYSITDNPKETLCNLCEKLTLPIKPKIYHDIVDWWYGSNGNPKCPKINAERLLDDCNNDNNSPEFSHSDTDKCMDQLPLGEKHLRVNN